MTGHPRRARTAAAGCAGALAAERVPERRGADGLFAGAFDEALDARGGAFDGAFVEAFAVVVRGFAGLFGASADSFAATFDGAFAGPLADRPEAPVSERPEALLGASGPLLY